MVVLRRAMLGAGAQCDPVLPSYRGTTTQKRSSSAPGPLPHLSNRVFETYEAIIEAACDAWRSLLLAAEGAPPPVPPVAKSGVDLNARGLVAVKYGYHGGRFVGRTMTGYLQQDGWTEAGCPLWLTPS